MKKFMVIVLSIVMIFALAACGGSGDSGEAAEDSYTIRLAHVCGQDAQYDVGADKFKELVEERSEGRISVDVYAGDMTTDEIEGTEMVQNGNLEMLWVGTGSISGFVPELAVLDLPFLFEDQAHVEESLAGEFGDLLLGKVSDLEGIEALAWAEDGWRNVLTNGKVVNSVEDMEGLRIRTMMNETCPAMYEALGAVPVALASGEIYTAIQTGTVDGQDNSVLPAIADGYIEVIDSICYIHHFYTAGMVIANDGWYFGLSEEDQTLLRECAEEAGAFQRSYFLEADQAAIDEYEKKGYTVTYPDDVEAWKEKTAVVYDQMFEKYPEYEELVNMIRK